MKCFSPISPMVLASFFWLALMSAADTSAASTPESAFVSLFNGKDLSGWHVMNGARFSVKDGVIVLDKGGGWLRSDKQFKDFELRLEFRFLDKGANSGFFLRANADNGPSRAYQVQTMDGDSLGDLYTRGLAKPMVQRDTELLKKVMKPVGEWQSYTITVKSGHLEVRLNGERITVAENVADQPGYLGPQGEGGRLEFRNLRIRE